MVIRVDENTCGLCGEAYLYCATPNNQARIFAATKGLALAVDDACPNCGNSGPIAPPGEDYFTRYIKANGSGIVNAG